MSCMFGHNVGNEWISWLFDQNREMCKIHVLLLATRSSCNFLSIQPILHFKSPNCRKLSSVSESDQTSDCWAIASKLNANVENLLVHQNACHQLMTHQNEEFSQTLSPQLTCIILRVKGTFWANVESHALMQALVSLESIHLLHKSWKWEWSPPLFFSKWKITVTVLLDPICLLIQAVKIKYMSCNLCVLNYFVIEAFDTKLQLDCDLWIPQNLATFV